MPLKPPSRAITKMIRMMVPRDIVIPPADRGRLRTFRRANKRDLRKFRLLAAHARRFVSKTTFASSELPPCFRGRLRCADIAGFQRRHRKVLEQVGQRHSGCVRAAVVSKRIAVDVKLALENLSARPYAALFREGRVPPRHGRNHGMAAT